MKTMTSAEFRLQVAKGKIRVNGGARRVERETIIMCEFAKYMKLSWPNILWKSDWLSGVKMGKKNAGRASMLSSGRGWPDVFIAACRGGKGGLWVEVKREGVVIVKQDGELVADKHIGEQADMIRRLRSAGYAAQFACGLDALVDAVEQYLQSPWQL